MAVSTSKKEALNTQFKSTRWSKNSQFLCGATLIATCLTWLLFQSTISRFTYDLLSLVSPADGAENSVVILKIDEATLEAMPAPWPWPRQYYGEMLYLLDELGASQIGFDIQFIDPRDSEGDDYFAQAISDVGNIVLASDMVERNTEFFSGMMALEPLSLFTDAGAKAGLVGVDRDVDGVIRTAPMYEKTFSSVLAGHTKPLESGMKRLIRYQGGAETIDTISLMQLFIENGVKQEQIAGKTVLVGWGTKGVVDSAGGQVDQFPSPWTRWDGLTMPGVEVHATLIDNYKKNSWLYEFPAWLELLSILITVSASVIPMMKFRPIWSFAMPLVFVSLSLGCSLLLWQIGYFFNALLAAPIVLVAYITASLLAYRTEGKQKRQLKNAFGQYLSPDMVSNLVADPSQLKLGGETRDMTIMFCDIRGFTAISEALKDKPLKLTEVINRLLTGLSTDILATGGTIDKYMGDCIMAFWNAPLQQSDHAARATSSAESMLNHIDGINDELIRDGLASEPFRVGIGVGSGICVVGNMGSEQRFDYTVLGDVVNTVSRLEGMTKQYGVGALLTGQTVESLVEPEQEKLLEIDWVQMKGKSEATTVYALFRKPITNQEKANVGAMLKAYRSGDFQRSIEELQPLRESEQLGNYAKVMEERAKWLFNNPQREKWDGIFRATQK